MKNSHLVILASIMIAVPLVFILKFGINPRPKPVIKPSNFESFNKIGRVLFTQLARDIESHSIVAIGIVSSDDLEIVDGFISQSIKAKKFFDEVVVLTNDKILFDIPTEHMPYETKVKVVSYLTKAINFGQRLIVIAKNWDTPHFQKDSFVENLEFKDTVLSITSIRGNFNLNEIKKRCSTIGVDSLLNLNCIAYKNSIKLIKKSDGKNMVSAQRYGLRDYVYTILER